jgi:hypothetical protein
MAREAPHHEGVWRNGGTNPLIYLSKIWYVQLEDAVTLPPGKNPPMPVWMLERCEKSLPYRESNLVFGVVKPDDRSERHHFHDDDDDDDTLYVFQRTANRLTPGYHRGSRDITY